MQIPGQIAVGGGTLLVDGDEGDASQHRMGAIPVVGVRSQLQLLVHYPVAQYEGAVAHQLAGLGPLVAVLFHAGPVQGRQAGVGQQAQEVGHRLGERHLQGMVIHGLHPERLGRQLALDYLVHLVEVGQLGKPGEGGRLLGIHQLAPAIDEVGGAHRIPVGPAGIRPQMERELPVVLVLPACGHTGQHLAVLPLSQQPLIEVSEHLQLGQADQLERTQAGRFVLEMTHDGLFGGELGTSRYIGGLDTGTAQQGQQGAPSFHGESFKLCEARRKLGENSSPADGES